MEVVAENPVINTVPEGFKWTEVGVIPEDWKVVKIEEFLSFKNGLNKAKKYFGSGTPIVNYMDVFRHSGLFKNDLEGKVTLSKKEIRRYEVKKGDLFFTRTSETVEEVGISAVMLEDVEDTVYSGFVLRGRPIDSVTDLYFRKYCFDSEIVRRQIQSSATHTTRALTNGGSLSKVLLSLPPTLDEQRAIAEALSDVDALIAALGALIQKKQQVKKGAMQQLLTCKKRLPGFDGEWEEKKLGDVAVFSKGKGLPKKEIVANVKNKCIHYGELFTHYDENINEIKSRTNKDSNTFTSQANDVLMPTSDVTPNGLATASCVKEDDVVLGGDILVIRVAKDSFNGVFLSYCITIDKEQVMQFVSGTTVYHLYASGMYNFTFKIPPIEEQNAIVEILDDMDAEIQSLQAKRAKYQKIKQGMMQELLTGKTRLVPTQVDQSESKDQKKSGHNWQIDEAVLISVLADRFGSKEYPIGRFRRTKLSYLVRRFLASNVDQFLKKAAGPYNHNTRYSGPEKIALDNGYVQEWENGKYSGFIADENIPEAQEYFEGWHGLDALDWLDNGFRYKKNEDLELLTTVDKSIVELTEEGKEVSLENVKAVIASHPEWEEKLERDLFSDENIEGAIKQSLKLFR